MDAALPAGSGGVIAVYDSTGAVAVDNALVNAVRKSVAQIDSSSAKEPQGRPGRGPGRHGRLRSAHRAARPARCQPDRRRRAPRLRACTEALDQAAARILPRRRLRSQRSAAPHEVKRLGHDPLLVAQLAIGDASVEVAADDDEQTLLLGPYGPLASVDEPTRIGHG
jgi:hypothetical protein